MLGALGRENLGETNQGRGCSGKSLTRGKANAPWLGPWLGPWHVTAVHCNYIMETIETTTLLSSDARRPKRPLPIKIHDITS